jgi:hypothetical protein
MSNTEGKFGKVFVIYTAINDFSDRVAKVEFVFICPGLSRFHPNRYARNYPTGFASTRPFGTLGPVALKYALTVLAISASALPARDAFNFLLDLASYPNLVHIHILDYRRVLKALIMFFRYLRSALLRLIIIKD